MSNLGINDGPAVRVVADGAVARIQLNRPRVLNAFNHDLRENLVAAVHKVHADDAVRVVVIEGEGRAFSAGQDQKEAATMDAEGAQRRMNAYSALFAGIRQLEKPLIAKIRGHAAGAGLQLALLSDLRIAGVSAQLGMTELKVGSVPMMGSAVLKILAGDAVMKRMVLMADFIPAAQALSYNLLHEVVPDDALDERVAEIAARLAAYSPVSMRLTKQWWRTLSDDVFEVLARESHKAHAENFAAGGMSEGARAFLKSKGA